MIHHFTENLNTRGLIVECAPKVVVEAGCGQSTLQLLNLSKELGFRMILVDVQDDPVTPGSLGLTPGELTSLRGIELLYGVSYLGFEKLPDGFIDVAIVDTDHNGWTLAKELAVLERKVRDGGIVILHDTFAFRDVNGTMSCYASGEIPYPLEEILAGPTMGQVVDEYRQKWEVIRETDESNGAIAFRVRA